MHARNPFSKEILKTLRNYIWQHIFRSSAVLIYIFTLGYLVWCLIVLTKFGPNPWLFLFPFIVVLFIYYYSVERAHRVLLKEFATLNKFKFERVGDPRLLEGTVFKQGHSHRMYQVVRGTFIHHPFTLFTFEYATGSGNQAREYASTILELDLEKQLPHIVMVSKYHKQRSTLAMVMPIVHAGSDGFPMHTDGTTELSVEGTFYKYFDLHITSGHELEALEIFTPDLMEDLINDASKYSMEMVDDKIYIVYGDIITDIKELQAMYDIAQKLSARMAFLLERRL